MPKSAYIAWTVGIVILLDIYFGEWLRANRQTAIYIAAGLIIYGILASKGRINFMSPIKKRFT